MHKAKTMKEAEKLLETNVDKKKAGRINPDTKEGNFRVMKMKELGNKESEAVSSDTDNTEDEYSDVESEPETKEAM